MENIDELLNKYFEGETSLQEEEMLRDYFAQSTIDEKYKMYAPMFSFFSQERNEQPTNVIPLKPKKKKLWLYASTAVAAVALLIVFVRLVTVPNDNDMSKSLVYINGKKIYDTETINTQALISIDNVSYIDEDAANTQISILDSFID